MPAVNQNFTVPSGDNISPVVTILNAAGLPLDISTASDVLFIATINDSIEVEKSLILGTISFVTTGADGQVQIIFTAADFAKLTGVFPYQMYVIDVYGNITEVINYSAVTVTTSYRGVLV